MKIIYSKKCLEYILLASPEEPIRVENCANFLKEKGYEFIEPILAEEEDILLAHSQKLINNVKNEIKLEAVMAGAENFFKYPLLSAGGAVKSGEITLETGEKAFSLMRPPGHHAGKDVNGGFCYFNNIAIAVAKSLKKVKRAAILDLDCHHGNGTEDIFLRNSEVIFASLHQSPLYPGTGLFSGFNCYNFPLAPNTTEDEYLYNLDIAIRKIYEFSPNLLAISMGFDTYKKDPVGDIKLELETYKKIGERIKFLKLPTFGVLEGGYNAADMPACLDNFLEGLGE